MVTKTFYILGSNAVTPNFWGNMQDTAAPASANSAFGWAPAKTSTATPYYPAHLGATNTNSSQSATSLIASASGPTKGTGTGATTAGDSFVIGPYSGKFLSGAWTLNPMLRATVAGAIGHLNMRVWASVNADGSSARELTSGSLIGTPVTLSTSVDVNGLGTTGWTPPDITLLNEYLFFQFEWQETTTGTSNSNDVLFRISTGLIGTFTFIPINIILVSELDVGALALGTPVITQTHNLTSNNLVTQAVIFVIPVQTTSEMAIGSLAPFGTKSFGGIKVIQPVVLAFTANNLVTGALELGNPVLTKVLSATNLTTGSPTFTNPVLTNALTANNLTVASPTLGTPIIEQVLSANNLVTGALVLGNPGLNANFIANNLTVGSPTFGTPVLTKALNANNLVLGSPTLGTPVFIQKHIFVADNLVTSSVTFTAATIIQTHKFVSTQLTTGALTLQSPVITQNHHIATAGLTTGALTVTAVTLVQTHIITSNNLTVGSPTLGIPQGGYVFTASTLSIGALTLQSPVMVSTTLIITDDATDIGFRTFLIANKLLICNALPTTYGEALAFQIAVSNPGIGNVLSANPSAHTNGMKFTVAAITSGVTTANGTPFCWAIIDDANTRLLATGPMSNKRDLTTDYRFTLESFIVHRPAW